MFLLGAALAGFAMGRLGKGLVGAGTAAGDGGGVYRSRYAEATSGYPATPGTADVGPPAPAWSQARTAEDGPLAGDRKSTRLNSSHTVISYAVFCLKKKRTSSPTSPLIKKKNKKTAR